MDSSQTFKPEIKLFVLVAFIAVVISVGVILLLRTTEPASSPTPTAQQTPPPAPEPQPQPEVLDTSGWKTYRNDEFGFEVRYPESFLRKEFPARTNEGVFGVSLKDKKYQEGHYPTLNVVVIKTSLSPREWLEEYYDPAGPPILGDIPEPPTGYENVEEIAINGIPALRFRLLAPSDSSLSTIIQGKPGTLYHVQAISSGLGNFPRELHDQILATFRFIK